MKIGIEVQRLFRKKRFGIESSALELIRALSAQDSGFEFVVFARDDVNRQLESADNLQVRTVAGRLFVDFEQFYLPLAAKRERIDVLHCTGNTAPYFSPVPVIQTLHDVIFMDKIPPGDSWYQRFGNQYRRKMVPLVTPRSKAVITVSEYEKQRILQSVRVNPERVHVVYNGINTARFHARYGLARQYEVRQEYGLPDQFILFLGNEATRKNPSRVLDAYAQYSAMSDNPLPLVTPGLSRPFINEHLARLNVEVPVNQLIAPGYIADEDLPVLYQISTMFLFPSLSEGFGMPLIEAMAAGTPVITSNISAMPEIAGSAALLVDPYEPSDLATAMLRLSSNAGLRECMREMGFKNAARFSWENAAGRILKLYEMVHAESLAAPKVPAIMSRPARHAFSGRHWK